MARKKINPVVKDSLITEKTTPEKTSVTEKKENIAGKVLVRFFKDTETNWGKYTAGEHYVVENCARTQIYLNHCERVK